MAQDMLTKGQFATIDSVLKRYRDAQDRTEGHIEAVVNIAPDLDAWLRSLLEIVKTHEVTWIPCEKRMPDTSRYVWVGIPDQLLGIQKRVQGVWVWGFACGDTRIPATLWAEIRWPEPPQKEGGDASEAQTRS